MPCLDYDNHVEVRLLKDKPAPPPKSDNGATFFAVAISLPITFTLFGELIGGIDNFNLFPPEEPPAETYVAPDDDIPRGGISGPTPPLPAYPPQQPLPPLSLTPGTYAHYVDSFRNVQIQIEECNGHYPPGANFRSQPELSPGVILGAVMTGEWVKLTGRRIEGDGIVWYEARNESRLEISLENPGSRRLWADQIGWIAACFVE